jgi:hypothetical protein
MRAGSGAFRAGRVDVCGPGVRPAVIVPSCGAGLQACGGRPRPPVPLREQRPCRTQGRW